MRSKRLISLLVAVCMMITMLPLSAVTAFAADTASSTGTASYKGYKYDYKVDANGNATITKFHVLDNSQLYDIEIPEKLGIYTVTAINRYAFDSRDCLRKVTIPQSVTFIGDHAFHSCKFLESVTINNAATSIWDYAFAGCNKLTTLSLGEKIKTISNFAFEDCSILDNVTIPDSVTFIGRWAFVRCPSLTTLKLGEKIETIGQGAFGGCSALTNVTIPEKVKTIEPDTFNGCSLLESITLPAGLTSFQDSLNGCPAGNPNGAIYYKNYKAAADALLADNDANDNIGDNDKLRKRNFLYLCNVTFDANGGTFKDGTSAPVTIKEIWRTEKVATKGDVPANPTRKGYVFDGWYYTDNVARAMTAFDPATEGVPDTITLYAAWRQTDTLATVAISGLSDGDTLVKGKEYPFTVKITPDGDAGNGKLTLTLANGGTLYQQKDDGTWEEMTSSELDIALVSKSYQFKLIPDQTGPNTLTAGVQKDGLTGAPNTDEVSFTVRDYEDGTVTIEGLENAVIKKGESKDFTVKVTPNDDAKLGEAFIDFGDKNSEIEYKDENNEYKPMPEGGLPIDLSKVKEQYTFRITPKETGKQTLTAAVKKGENKLAKDEKDFVVSEMPILTLKDGVITSVTVPGKNGADPEDITDIVKKNANEDGSFHVPEGATVSVAFDKDAFADSGLKFGHWDITGLDDPNAYQDKESFAFVMPAKAVTLKAMTQDASIEDDEPDIVGPIVIGTTVVVGGAVLGYQAYSLGAEFAGKLMALPYFPSNRSALAMMLWEDAGKPMPESELLYPDVGQEERDMDLQHAARWAMENELIPDLNDEGTAPEEMKFYPDNAVSKIDVLNAWQKAQELKQNA